MDYIIEKIPQAGSQFSGDIPKLYVLANLSSGEGGTSSTLETVTPKAGAGSDVTVVNTATPPVIKERLDDLDEEDPCATAPITVAGSMVAAEGVSGIQYTRSHQRLCAVSQHSCCPASLWNRLALWSTWVCILPNAISATVTIVVTMDP